jgi:hypothetical protein
MGYSGGAVTTRAEYSPSAPKQVGRYNFSTYSIPVLKTFFADPQYGFGMKWDMFLQYGGEGIKNPEFSRSLVRETPELMKALEKLHPIEAQRKRVGRFSAAAHRELSDFTR